MRIKDEIARNLSAITACAYLMVCAGCAIQSSRPDLQNSSTTQNESPVAGCRINSSLDIFFDFDRCVESVTSDGTLILNPAVMDEVYSKLEANPHYDKHHKLWLVLGRDRSPSSMFPGPVVAYIGRGPSGVNLARSVVYSDNGPDFFAEECARSISKSGKVGFIGSDLKTVVREYYDYATPFKNGTALVCTGCRLSDDKREHLAVVGGDWSIIDKNGDLIKGPGLTDVQAREGR